MVERTFNPSGYDMPQPTRVALLDDYSNGITEIHLKIHELARLLDTSRKPIVVDSNQLVHKLNIRLERAISTGQHPQPDLFIGIGRTGYTIATEIYHQNPVCLVTPYRSKNIDGTNEISTRSGIALQQEIEEGITALGVMPRCIAIVDDTIFTGNTLAVVSKTLQDSLPYASQIALTLTYTPAFVDQFIPPVIAGLTLRTNKDGTDGINSLDVRDFFEDDALPLGNETSISFSREDNWMRAWFGPNVEQAIQSIQAIKELMSAL